MKWHKEKREKAGLSSVFSGKGGFTIAYFCDRILLFIERKRAESEAEIYVNFSDWWCGVYW